MIPIRVLGDVVISVDAAARQAAELQQKLGTQYETYDEVRVLLLHGFLHLLGFDHEAGGAAAEAMAQCEAMLLKEVGWQGSGLIGLATAGSDSVADSCNTGAAQGWQVQLGQRCMVYSRTGMSHAQNIWIESHSYGMRENASSGSPPFDRSGTSRVNG